MLVSRRSMVAAVPVAALAAVAPAEAKMRETRASWYGPGLWGNLLGCGGRLHEWTRGVAHKTLPCGTRLLICARRCSTAVVIDRGPFVGGREFDLTQTTAGLVRLQIDASGSGRVRVRRLS